MADTFWTAQYWRNVAEMAVTGAAMGVGFAMPDPQHPQWLQIGLFAAAGALALAAKSIVSNRFGPQTNTPMLTAVAPHGWNPVDPLGDG
jgi:hypothetical protein